ncbi:MAG: hypothetical protein HKN00_09860, partial [Flavobacteriaceae bacterium]|nr:hypothetical protein [Flavobacteriaceae bacterium]
ADPSGSWIYLLNGAGPELDISACGPPIIGNFAGVSLESVDINKSVKLFQILGFKVTMGAIEQGWICLANADEFTVSLMKPFACPHLFFNPSLTYFNSGNNPAIIAKVRELQIPITEEITHFSKDGSVDNIIIRDPGGLGFFVFND